MKISVSSTWVTDASTSININPTFSFLKPQCVGSHGVVCLRTNYREHKCSDATPTTEARQSIGDSLHTNKLLGKHVKTDEKWQHSSGLINRSLGASPWWHTRTHSQPEAPEKDGYLHFWRDAPGCHRLHVSEGTVHLPVCTLDKHLPHSWWMEE